MHLTAIVRSASCKIGVTPKMWRVMKITAFFLLGWALSTSATGISQTVTIDLKNVPVQRIFKEVIRQTGISIVYSEAMFADAPKVSIKVKDAKVEDVLQQCLQGLAFEALVEGNSVVVKKRSTSNTSPLTPLLTERGDEPPPPIDVKGRVVNENGEGVIATVTVKGTKKAVTTDENGFFVIKGVDENATLVITATNIETREIKVDNKTDLANVPVKIKVGAMEEVIIKKGYYNESQRYTLGNSVHIDAKTIEQQPVQNVLLALTGRVTGLEITQGSGLPGAGVTTRIQGRNSVANGLEPYIVVDGVPIPSALVPGMQGMLQNGSPLTYINPSDIESIDILKDADATAIYGSKAANGAIIITTKKGKAGKTKININAQQGWGKVARHVDMLKTPQYLEMRREAFRNNSRIPSSNPSASGPFVYAPDLMFWDTTRYTDWQKELIGGAAKYTDINITVSGGSPLVQYLVGATYRRQTTVFPGNFDDKTGAFHFNLNSSSANQKFNIQLSGSYLFNNNHLPGVDLTDRAVLTAPNAPALHNSDGTLNWAQDAAGSSTFINPLAYTLSSDFENQTNNVVSNLNVSYQFFSGLKIRTNLGYTITQSEIYTPLRLESYAPELRSNYQRESAIGNTNLNSWIIEPQLQYSGKLSKGKIEAVLGTTINKGRTNSLQVYGAGYPSDLLMKSLKAATSIQILSSGTYFNRFNALFGRVGYNWDDKYLANFTFRRDGSDKFGERARFHNFGSLAIGWIFSEQRWFQKILPFVTFGKLRTSYGITGNDQIPIFSYLSYYNISSQSIFYQNNIGLDVFGIPNPYLQWEETRKWQSGLDLGLFKDRLLIGATYVRNRSNNQLIAYPLPTVAGFTTMTKNLPALIQNTSCELVLNTVNVRRKNFSWSTNFNLTIPKNKLLEFPGIENTIYAAPLNGYGIVVGQPLGAIPVYKHGGVNPANGAYIGLDQKGNPVFNPSLIKDFDRYISPFPKFYGGLNNSFRFKGIQLDFLFQFVNQTGKKDMFYSSGYSFPGQVNSFDYGRGNQPIAVLNRWQKAGDNADVSRFSYIGGNIPANADEYNNSKELSYIRIKNLSLSWELGDQWVQKRKLQSVKIYTHVQNLLTISEYRGLDPETKSSSVLPPLRLWTVGLQVGL